MVGGQMQHGVARGAAPVEAHVLQKIQKAVTEARAIAAGDGALASTAVAAQLPEYYTLWNRRRTALLRLPEDELQKALAGELDLVMHLLLQNPKAYSLWYHRLWAIKRVADPALVAREFAIVQKMLAKDERNFHAWAYRLLLRRTVGGSAEEELKFASEKIDSNFSNFSAWHFRSLYLREVHTGGHALAESLEEDWEKCHSAFYTDPDDQTAWIFHRWLLEATGPASVVASLCVRRSGDGLQVGIAADHPLSVGGRAGERLSVLGHRRRVHGACRRGRHRRSISVCLVEIPAGQRAS